MESPRRWVGLGLLVAVLAAAAGGEERDAKGLYEARIGPILRSDRPSSCTACHLSGVELRDYLREDPVETFAALREAGWINLERSEDSKLLEMIARQPPRPDPHLEQVRQTELTALGDWLRAAVRDPEFVQAKATRRAAAPVPVEVIRHARRDRVLAAFVDNVWSEMGRCVNCHSPERNRGRIKTLGQEAVDAISWIVPDDPGATLERLVADGNIDLDEPESSQLLTKPAGQVEHGGGQKFLSGDPAYRKFLSFLTDYAAVRRQSYRSVKDLPESPEELTLLTEFHLRVTGIPERWRELPWQVDLYTRDADSGEWSTRRGATVFGKVNREGVGQHMVSIVLPADQPPTDEVRRHPRLPGGPWLARLYIDRERKTEQDPWYRLGALELVGEALLDGEWRPGYQPPRIVEFKQFQPR